MIFNYLTYDFKGVLLEDSPEGKATWVNIKDAYNLLCKKQFEEDFPYSLRMEHLKYMWNGTMRKTKKVRC